jgi:hypothetical protein
MQCFNDPVDKLWALCGRLSETRRSGLIQSGFMAAADPAQEPRFIQSVNASKRGGNYWLAKHRTPSVR